MGGGVGGEGSGWGGQGGCDQRIEELKFFGKIHNYKKIGWGGGGEQRIEVFVKIQKKKKKHFFGGVSRGGGVRVGGSGWM